MTRISVERNLQFGLTALQMGLISRDELISAATAWLADKSKSLDVILLDRHSLDADTRALLFALLEKQRSVPGANSPASLATIALADRSLLTDLISLADEELGATLSVMATGQAEDTDIARSGEPGASATGTPSTEVRYQILRLHARGGLGRVSVALDTELHREVALKDIQDKYADDPASRSRFLLEAEITGRLEHPGVVPVYGLGTLANGRPFYAMRFIRGESLKEAIDRFHAGGPADKQAYQSLEFRQLLNRFIDVCNAMAYAHHRGVLHRDLKPANIMLGEYGETLVVDWGLSKVIDESSGAAESGGLASRFQSGGGSAASTQLGSAMGTPQYMPPEQAAGELDRLSPASDLYSLGATLYHLLTGQPPFVGNDIQSMLQQVRQGDFPPPREVRPAVPPALEAICMRAMRKAPKDRYASAQQLADDIERWLADEPVSTHREPVSVRARRWMRKHPRLVSVVAAAILFGLISTAAIAEIVSRKNQELFAANTELDETNQQLESANDSLTRANQAERAARQEAEAILDFFRQRVLATARPKDQEGGLGVDVTVRAAVDAAEPLIGESFPNQPLAEASLRQTIGLTYLYLGEPDLAIVQHQRTLDLRQQHLGSEHEKTQWAMNDLALDYKHANQLDKAFELYEQVLATTEKQLGPDHDDTLSYKNNLGEALRAAGKLERSLALLQDTYQRRRRLLGLTHAHTQTTMNNLALALEDAGRRDEAVPLFEQTLELRRDNLGPDHPQTLQSMNNLAAAYAAGGEPERAVTLHQQAWELLKKNLTPDHPETLRSQNNLALALFRSGEVERALDLHRQTLEMRRARLGSLHWDTLQSLSNLSKSLLASERIPEARTVIEEFVARERNTAKGESSDFAQLLGYVAEILAQFKQEAAAETYLRESVALYTQHWPTDQASWEAKGALGGVLAAQGKFEEAETLLTESYQGLSKLREQAAAEIEPSILAIIDHHVALYTAWEKPDQAAKWRAKRTAAER